LLFPLLPIAAGGSPLAACFLRIFFFGVSLGCHPSRMAHMRDAWKDSEAGVQKITTLRMHPESYIPVFDASHASCA